MSFFDKPLKDMDLNIQFSSQRFVIARNIAMVCFSCFMCIMFCCWILIVCRKGFWMSNGRARHNEEEEELGNNGERFRENIEMERMTM